jgi:CDP-diacylglycerol--glycerol-3-phosphate 3-phosphatidyltransferase
MVLSPVLVVLMLDGRTGFRIAAFAVFIFAALTDLYDGYLARRYGWVTNLGKFLDPLADKLLVSFVLVALVSVGLVPVWAAYLIIGRELLVTGLRSVAAYAGVLILPSKLGKWKATVQMISLTLYMLLALLQPDIHSSAFLLRLEQVSLITLFIAVALTLISGIDYFWRNKGVLRRLLM